MQELRTVELALKKQKGRPQAAFSTSSPCAPQTSVLASSGRIGRLMVMSAPLPGVERIST